MLFCNVLSIFALSCRCSVLLLEDIQFLSHVLLFVVMSRVFRVKILPVCRMKFLYKYFCFYFGFRVFIDFLSLLTFPIGCYDYSSFPLFNLNLTSIYSFVNAIVSADEFIISSFDTYILSMSSFSCKDLSKVIRFPVMWFICLNSSLSTLRIFQST